MAMIRAKVDGVQRVAANLNRELRGVENRSRAGMWAAGLKVRAEAQRRVPVEFGNLRASAYTRFVEGSSRSKPTVEIGFTAKYAIYVHENVEERLRGLPRPPRRGRSVGIGVYWGPRGRSKYLESALQDLRGEVLRIVAAYAAVGR